MAVCRRLNGAFSSTELVVVLAVTGLLLGISMSGIQRVRGAALRLACQNNLRQIGIAVHHCADNEGQLPPTPSTPKLSHRGIYFLWPVALLQYIEQDAILQQVARAVLVTEDYRLAPPHTANLSSIRLYICPADSRFRGAESDYGGVITTFTSYCGVYAIQLLESEGVGGRPGPHSQFGGPFLASITDGTSNTIYLGERPPPRNLQAGRWYTADFMDGATGPHAAIAVGKGRAVPDTRCADEVSSLGPGRLENPCDRFHFWSLHGGGANFLFVDGSVRFIPYSSSARLAALSTFDGGEAISDE
jgi:prepilin-type processing-associated H-X9-DG protein